MPPNLYSLLAFFQDPPGYEAAVVALDPEPVDTSKGGHRNQEEGEVGNKRKKSTGSTKSKKKQKREEPDPTVEDETEILESFAQSYRAIIRALPCALWPSSTRHGEHSYTVFLTSNIF